MSDIQNGIPKIKQTFYTKYGKRFFDIIFSGLAIVTLSWVFLIIGILELVFHGTPIIYKQDRLGKDEKHFFLYKFRSMNNNVDSEGKLLPGKERITKFGRILRRLSIDELPELWNIFIGEMSIIGPRPLLPEYSRYYTKRHTYRHVLKPGLALLPLKEMKTWTWNDQFETDIWYVENCSFLIDFRMTFAVLKEAVKGSEYRVNATREKISSDYWKV